MPRRLAALTLAVALGSLQAHAEEPDTARGRFALSPVDGGVMRLDKETGAVAYCAKKGETWSCDPVADKARDLEDKLKALEEENRTLKDHLKTLEAAQAPAAPTDPSAPDGGPPTGSMPLPSEEDVDKAFDYFERMFKKFKERVQKFEPPKDGAPQHGAPNSGGGEAPAPNDGQL